MTRIVRLTEADLHKIIRSSIRQVVNEAARVRKYPPPVFGDRGGRVDYHSCIKQLDSIDNLYTDRYKDYELDDAWKAWGNVGYDKNTDEYIRYRQAFINFMFGKYGDISFDDDKDKEGFIHHIKYTFERVEGVPLHSMVLDPKWTNSLINANKWKYSGSHKGGDEYTCFHTTILQLYQNPAIWNDFFFNPIFAKYRDMVYGVRAQLAKMLQTDQRTKYLALLPLPEYSEINRFTNKDNVQANCHPERFFNPNEKISSDDNPFADVDDEY